MVQQPLFANQTPQSDSEVVINGVLVIDETPRPKHQRTGQSPWDRVSSSTYIAVTIGAIETSISARHAEMLIRFCKQAQVGVRLCARKVLQDAIDQLCDS